jgi:hypothetical protein
MLHKESRERSYAAANPRSNSKRCSFQIWKRRLLSTSRRSKKQQFRSTFLFLKFSYAYTLILYKPHLLLANCSSIVSVRSFLLEYPGIGPCFRFGSRGIDHKGLKIKRRHSPKQPIIQFTRHFQLLMCRDPKLKQDFPLQLSCQY